MLLYLDKLMGFGLDSKERVYALLLSHENIYTSTSVEYNVLRFSHRMPLGTNF